MTDRTRSQQTTASVDTIPQPDDVVAGKYRIERVLGQGGMGVVFAARHLLTHQRVALKFLLLDPAYAVEQTQRFLNEARAAVRIQSEHVGRVVDVGTLPSGAPFMVMEFLDGQDLGAVIGARGPLLLQDAVGYVLQACEALAEAHALGIVHRDLKPANLFLSRRRDGSPLVKVLDFGISRLNVEDDESAPRLTQTRGAFGSPLYMSPEQLLTPKDVDARSDLWSLGVVLHELLTASWPFRAETPEGLVVQIVTQAPASLCDCRPDLPRDFVAVVDRCLSKDREGRFGSIAELAAALAPFATVDAQISVARVAGEVVAGRASLPEMRAPRLPSPVPAPPVVSVQTSPRQLPIDERWDGRATGEEIVLPIHTRWYMLAGAIACALVLLAGLIHGLRRDELRASMNGTPAPVASPKAAELAGFAAPSAAEPVLTPASSVSVASLPDVSSHAAASRRITNGLTPAAVVSLPPAVALTTPPARSAKPVAPSAAHPLPRGTSPTDFGGK